MAADFLRSHGIDLDAEMSRIQHNASALNNSEEEARDSTPQKNPAQTTRILNATLPNTPPSSLWDIHITQHHISSIIPHTDPPPAGNSPSSQGGSGRSINAHTALLAPSLCHPHIHLDKAYLLSHPTSSHLQIRRGDFAEAMELTGKAKAQFSSEDLLERGQRVIDESVAAGVTHMRAFVEVDAGVGTKCLEAGLQLKRAAEAGGRCHVQLCAFAQLPLFSPSPNDEDGGAVIRRLMSQAARTSGVDVVGSTPYVETHPETQRRNIDWMVDLALSHNLHLDFHLDYNLDRATEPMVWHVVQTLHSKNWNARNPGKTIVLGHCTRLTLFPASSWQRLKEAIADLPISFVGLPTSDLFMMRTPDRTRGTLDVPALIKDYGLNACIGINNIGNAFTPHGSCDPLTLACNGVGVYQAGTRGDAELLYECVSTRARAAIGLGCSDASSGEMTRKDVSREGTVRHTGEQKGLGGMSVGQRADFVLFAAEKEGWRTRRGVAEAVYLYDHCRGRRGFFGGRLTESS